MAKILITILGLGFIPLAPGTIGSIVGILFWLILIEFITPQMMCMFLVLVFFISWFFTEEYMKQENTSHDPSEVIIDELIGQWISLTPLLYLNYLNYTLNNKELIKLIFISFLLFRFFDIIKPWPINLIDRQVNSLSILMDDVVAGLFASMCLFIYISWNYLI